MTDFEMLKIVALVTPVAILVMVLAMLRLFILQDDRELRRRTAERKPEVR